jgi:hypothetical protein
MMFVAWWLTCYIVWVALMLWSDLSEVPRTTSAQMGFMTGLAGLLFLWPISVAMHALAETRFGRERGLIPLFVRWRGRR